MVLYAAVRHVFPVLSHIAYKGMITTTTTTTTTTTLWLCLWEGNSCPLLNIWSLEIKTKGKSVILKEHRETKSLSLTTRPLSGAFNTHTPHLMIEVLE